MKSYFRPLIQLGPARPSGAQTLAGGPHWFTHLEVLQRKTQPQVVAAGDVPSAALERLTEPRAEIADLDLSTPRLMGILNVTPDSFSDGGRHDTPEAAIAYAQTMIADGAAILDIGGELTRPGAATVSEAEEIERTAPVIAGLRSAGLTAAISVDTRKAAVARAALDAGATMVNDVSGFGFDPELAPLCAERGVQVCVMHAQGDPATMQRNPRYENVLLDVFDHLAERIGFLESCGIPRSRIIADPGIGFGKTQAHNLALLNRLGLFHALGVPILLGASRKRFVGTIGGAADAQARAAGSIGVTLAALAHGIQIHRVHDVAEQSQAIALWQAAMADNAS